MYNYIPHPSNCRVSSNVLRLLAKEGAAGYGIYWMLLELLRDAPSYSLTYEPEVLAYSLHIQDTDQVRRVCEQYGVFTIQKDGTLYSEWLGGAMQEYDERKEKLRAAGKRGAAHRWAGTSSQDSEPIATLSEEDSKPLAHNVTQSNVIERDITLPDTSQGPRVGVEYLENIYKTRREGFAPAYIAQVCMHYGMTEATCNLLIERTNGGEVANSTYKQFAALVRRIQAEKWTPKHPDGFFIKKVLAEP